LLKKKLVTKLKVERILERILIKAQNWKSFIYICDVNLKK